MILTTMSLGCDEKMTLWLRKAEISNAHARHACAYTFPSGTHADTRPLNFQFVIGAYVAEEPVTSRNVPTKLI